MWCFRPCLDVLMLALVLMIMRRAAQSASNRPRLPFVANQSACLGCVCCLNCVYPKGVTQRYQRRQTALLSGYNSVRITLCPIPSQCDLLLCLTGRVQIASVGCLTETST